MPVKVREFQWLDSKLTQVDTSIEQPHVVDIMPCRQGSPPGPNQLAKSLYLYTRLSEAVLGYLESGPPMSSAYTTPHSCHESRQGEARRVNFMAESLPPPEILGDVNHIVLVAVVWTMR